MKGRRLASAIAGLLFFVACSRGVGIAGTVPPPPGTLAPDPSDLTATATPPLDTQRPTAPPRATPAATSTGPIETMVVTNYLLLDSGDGLRLVPVPRTVERVPAIGGATLRALLDGPLQSERAAGIVSAIPNAVTLLGLSIESGTATVDLSTEFAGAGQQADLQARVAQVLYTLTQFSTVKRVAFEVDGAAVAVPDGDGASQTRPVTRNDYVSLLPAIFVETPRWGDVAPPSVRLTGSSNVFEATFLADLEDASGTTLFEKQVIATCGGGCWGTFDERLPYRVDRDQDGTLVVYDLSAKDGTVENRRPYRVELTTGG